jgi:RNA polymerase sigma-70 factor (ECF subfamily)
MDAPARSDASLLDAVRAGDGAALSALLARHAPRVLRFAARMCRDRADADDVLQETLFAAARSARELRGDASVPAWLFQVTRSFCIKKRRRGRHAPQHLLDLDAPEAAAHPAPEPSPDDALTARELARALEQALLRLDEEAREVVLMRDVEGLSTAEVAEALGLSAEAVKSRLHRARAQLRARLAPVVRAGEAAGD